LCGIDLVDAERGCWATEDDLVTEVWRLCKACGARRHVDVDGATVEYEQDPDGFYGEVRLYTPDNSSAASFNVRADSLDELVVRVRVFLALARTDEDQLTYEGTRLVDLSAEDLEELARRAGIDSECPGEWWDLRASRPHPPYQPMSSRSSPAI
jgi:hypothetical protein